MPNIAVLERAWECLEREKPASALAALKMPVPAPAVCERDFLAAEAWRAMGYFSKSEPLYRKVLASPKAERDLRADSAAAMASISRSLGRAAQAREFLRSARRFSREMANGYSRKLELEDALIDRAQGRYTQCLRRLQGLLRAFLKEKDFSSAAFVLWAMGGARRFSGDLAAAAKDFKRSVALARKIPDATAEAYALLGLGGVSRIAGQVGDSKKYYFQAARLLSRTQDAFGKAYAECGLANALRQAGDYAGAQARYRKAHRLYASLGDGVDLAYVDWGLGQAVLHLGDLKEAHFRFKTALDAFTKAKETRGMVIARTALAGVLHAEGRTKSAQNLFAQALAQSRRAKIYAHLEVLT